jgi:hypothetical protein
MPNVTDERLAALVARKAKLQRQIDALAYRSKKEARAADTRRKVIAGALALEHAAKNRGSEFARVMIRLLDEYARPAERFLFADLLPPHSPAGEAGKLAGDDPLQHGAESISNAAE